MFSTFEFSGARSIDASGRVFSYTSSNFAESGADPRLAVFADGASVGVLLPGGVIEVPEVPRQWRVEPVGVLPVLSGTVQVGEGSIRPGTVNGTVTVLDGEVARVMQGTQGIALMNRTGGAGGYAALALCNYDAGLNCVIRSLYIDSPTANLFVNLWVVGVTFEPAFNNRSRIRNKLVTDAATSFDMASMVGYALVDSTLPGFNAPDSDPVKFSNWQAFGSFRVSSAGMNVIDGAPLVLPAGFALVAAAGSPATTLHLRADIERKPV